MNNLDRRFELIQLLRRANRAMTAADLATKLEVNKRTIYRDMAALQSLQIPIQGEAGVGYLMGHGYDLPPLAFDPSEVEAIAVGLALINRTHDAGLRAAADRAAAKVANSVPQTLTGVFNSPSLRTSNWHGIPEATIDLSLVRSSIRDESKLQIEYQDEKQAVTTRTIWPLQLTYFIESQVLAAWCDLRGDIRHFRLDRIKSCDQTGARFLGAGRKLRARLLAIEASE